MIPYLLYSAITLSYIEFDKDSLNHPDDVCVSLDDSVDIEQSSFWYQDQEIYPQNKEIIFHVFEENESIFNYILKDSDGNILEESEKTIVLDTTKPDINVFVGEYEIEETIYVEDSIDISVNFNDIHLKETQLFLDDVLMSEDSMATVTINSDNKELKLIATDTFGNVTKRKIRIEKVEIPEVIINKSYDEYTLDPNILIQFSSASEKPIELVMKIDDIEVKRIDCKNQKEISLLLDQTGDISFILNFVHAPYIQLDIDQHPEY